MTTFSLTDQGADYSAAHIVEAPFANRQGLTGVRNVIVGSTKITGVQPDGDRVRVEVSFESNVTEKREIETQKKAIAHLTRRLKREW